MIGSEEKFRADLLRAIASPCDLVTEGKLASVGCYSYLLSFSPEAKTEVFPPSIRQYYDDIALIHLSSNLNSLVNYITSGPVLAAVFEADNAVARAREIMGTTDPSNAEAGTIRKDYGLDIEKNSVHGSDSVTTAENEIKLFFNPEEIVDYRRAD